MTSAVGVLTIKGIDQPTTLSFKQPVCTEHSFQKDANGSQKIAGGTDANTTTKCSLFGITHGVPVVSDEVQINIPIEAILD